MIMSEACPGVGDEAEPGQAAGPNNLKDWLTGAGFRFFWPLVQRGLYALLWALSRPQQLELRFFLAFCFEGSGAGRLRGSEASWFSNPSLCKLLLEPSASTSAS